MGFNYKTQRISLLLLYFFVVAQAGGMLFTGYNVCEESHV